MQTRKIEFTEEQMKNLAEFLGRVPINKNGESGKTLIECSAMNEIVTAINKEIIDILKNNKPEKSNK